MHTVDSGAQCHVRADASVSQMHHLGAGWWLGTCGVQRVYGESLYLPLSFAKTLKLLQEKVFKEERSEALTDISLWWNLKNMGLGERSQTQDTHGDTGGGGCQMCRGRSKGAESG